MDFTENVNLKWEVCRSFYRQNLLMDKFVNNNNCNFVTKFIGEIYQ